MSGPDVLDDLIPPSPEAQGKYWRSIRFHRQRETKDLEESFRAQNEKLQHKVAGLEAKHDDALARLRQAEQELEAAKDAVTDHTAEFDEAQLALTREWEEEDKCMKEWFSSRDGDKDASSHAGPDIATGTPAVDPPLPVNGNGHGNDSSEDSTGVHVYSGDIYNRTLLGKVSSAPIRHPVVVTLNGLPTRRFVFTRPDRNFGLDKLDSIYDPHYSHGRGPHAKPYRWVAIVGQAKGNIREGQSKCRYCARGLGPFKDCVIPDGPFTKCGNCEWAKQPCYWPKPLSDSEDSDGRVRYETAENSTGEVADVNGEEDVTIDTGATTTRRDSTLSLSSAPPQLWEEPAGDDHASPITPATLELRHNGQVYTAPSTMAGVPVAKIDTSHPYWDLSWYADLPAIHQAALDTYREKLRDALKENNKNQRFQNNRQVNRGETLMEFLAEGPCHPYQIVGKQFVDNRIVSYDNLFRLAETLSELQKYHDKHNGTVEVEPLDWVRQRLHELLTENRDKSHYYLAKALSGLYNDPKLVQIREANGKKSIGRPFGFKVDANAKDKRQDEVAQENKAPARATPPQAKTVPQAALGRTASESSRSSHPPPRPTDEPPRKKRKRKSMGAKVSRDEDLRHDGCTDVDEDIGAFVTSYDWKIYSIKTRVCTSDPKVTQYWNFVPHSDPEDRMYPFFQHQVPRHFEPGKDVEWGVYQKRFNFHVAPHEIREVVWAPGTTKVVVRCREHRDNMVEDGQPRGDVIAQLSRERTKQRFVVFCQRKGFPTTKGEAADIEAAWQDMQSPLTSNLGPGPNTSV